jgi:hypothetical protein
MPQFIEGEYAPFLKAKIILCSKRPDKRPKTYLENEKRQSSGYNGKKCPEGQYYDKRASQWKQCPSGLHPALGGYYCAPGNFIFRNFSFVLL